MQSSCKSNGIELGRFAETPSQKLNHTLTCEYYCFLILQLTASYVPGLNRSLTQVTAVANEFVETQQQSVYCVVSLSTLGSCIFIASKDARNHSWNTISKTFLGSMLSNPARCIAQSQLIDNLNESPPYLPPNSKRCLQPWPCSNITCSAKFLRRIIFTVFADSSRTVKIKLLETFRLNFPGVRGIVWKQNDSYSTFAVLRGRQEQHGTLLLFQSERFQIPGGRHRNFLRRQLHLSMGRCLWLETRS